ncbi:unnamed protein product [Adineta ricciae]|uniref:Uncharacterized protein n=1 Tax=Adineta ricciae TaxID=249248 RepID=A0A813MYU9_ADIRI|nr:unnamed protein product [Adineta ricciae]
MQATKCSFHSKKLSTFGNTRSTSTTKYCIQLKTTTMHPATIKKWRSNLLPSIAATVILSIIPTFTSDGSSAVNGEEYNCPAVMLKSLYSTTATDGSAFSFTNASIATNPALSTLSTAALKSISGKSNVMGCIVASMYGYGPYNTSTTSRRRRQSSTGGLLSIGQVRCFFSTPCAKQSDKGKYSNSTTLSSCVKDRLTATNSIFSKNGALTEWTPVSSSFTYNLVNTFNTGYATINVQRVFGISPSVASAYASNLGAPSSTQSQLLAGCTYAGQLSQSAIASIISSQYTETTTLPSSTVSG